MGLSLTEQDVQQLQQNRWFARLPIRYQDFILQYGQCREYHKDQAIFLSNDTFDGMYAVLHGSVRLGYIDVQGHETIAAIVAPIMWFGEISFIDGEARSHDAICMQHSKILKLPQSALNRLVSESPTFWKHLAELTSQKLRYAFLELISIQTQNIQQRVAQRLCFILNGYGNHLQIDQYELQLSQEQLGQMLVCSRQTINQALQALEKQGVLEVAFKKIIVLDTHKLHQLAYQANT